MHADPHDEQMPMPPQQDDVAEPSGTSSHPVQGDGLTASTLDRSREPGLPNVEPAHESSTGQTPAAQVPVFRWGPQANDSTDQAPDDAAELAPLAAERPVADPGVPIADPGMPIADPGESMTASWSDADLPSRYLGAEPADLPTRDSGAEPATGDLGAEPATFAPVTAAPASDGDWLDIICPYLLSEDGTWRSTQPDPGHRCTAQDPPGTLPSAFQERFCLTDRHDRCEMYKYAQTARTAALQQGGIAPAQVEGARFKPSVRSVPLALGPSTSRARRRGDGRAMPPRPWLVLAGIVGAVVTVVLIVLVIGGPGGSRGVAAPSPSTSVSLGTQPTPNPTRAPAPPPTAKPAASLTAGATPGDIPASVGLRIRYTVQEEEALARIAEKFGTTRQAILRANDGMADRTPFVTVGDVIVVPVSADMPEADVIAKPGFVEFVEDG